MNAAVLFSLSLLILPPGVVAVAPGSSFRTGNERERPVCARIMILLPSVPTPTCRCVASLPQGSQVRDLDVDCPQGSAGTMPALVPTNQTTTNGTCTPPGDCDPSGNCSFTASVELQFPVSNSCRSELWAEGPGLSGRTRLVSNYTFDVSVAATCTDDVNGSTQIGTESIKIWDGAGQNATLLAEYTVVLNCAKCATP